MYNYFACKHLNYLFNKTFKITISICTIVFLKLFSLKKKTLRIKMKNYKLIITSLFCSVLWVLKDNKEGSDGICLLLNK